MNNAGTVFFGAAIMTIGLVLLGVAVMVDWLMDWAMPPEISNKVGKIVLTLTLFGATIAMTAVACE